MNIFLKKLNTYFNKSIQQTKLKTKAGFTMIELMVTVSIFVVVTTVILASYPKFSSRIILEDVAQQVALSVRQAQTYGLSVKEFGAGNIFPGYGIYFPSLANDNKSFTIFADINGDKKYNLTGCGIVGSECLDKFTIQSGERIYALCVNLKNDGIAAFSTIDDLAGVNNCVSINSLHISFTRPNPDATITAYLGGANYDSSYSDAEIVVASPRGEVKTIVVWLTGQISVE